MSKLEYDSKFGQCELMLSYLSTANCKKQIELFFTILSILFPNNRDSLSNSTILINDGVLNLPLFSIS